MRLFAPVSGVTLIGQVVVGRWPRKPGGMESIMGGSSTCRGKGRPRSFDHDQVLRRALEVFWRKGFEPATVAELCKAMGITPPSLYTGFGSKAGLFVEAVKYYERTYWQEPAERLFAEPDIHRAIAGYFAAAARILLSPDTPCGCLVVLGAVNISEDATEVVAAVQQARQQTRQMFVDRLRSAIAAGQLPPDTDARALAGALTALLDGLSLQARDGLRQSELVSMAAHAVALLPLP